ncbi:RNI-like protein, partial [Phellopilus nigrolimitatus]
MSRVPRPAVSTGSLRNQYHASTSSTNGAQTKAPTPNTPSGLRVPHSSTAKRAPSPRRKETEEKSSTARLSLKEQIALRRAEAKKAQATQNNSGGVLLSTFGGDDDLVVEKSKDVEEDVNDLGRWSIRETVERARSTGNFNISSRSLVCIPSCLFEVHLGVTPKPLDSVTEPDYPVDDAPKRNRQNKQQPSWFEAQDLMVLKARSNEIVALQPELSLFGSLKVVDLHNNRLSTLPASLSILACLTTLDVSNNNLTAIPPPLFSLPALATLNLAHNQLTSLPFSRFNDPVDLPESVDTGAFFQPEVSRAIKPLPNLHVLDLGHNKITSASIDTSHLPSAIKYLTLAHNPLGKSQDLFTVLAKLENLQEVHMEHTGLTNESFIHRPPVKFSRLQLLDISETDVTEQAVRAFFAESPRSGGLSFQITTAPPSPGELRIAVGKKVVREAWEIEAEKNYLKKKKSFIRADTDKQPAQTGKETREIETEQGLTSEGGHRRAHVAVTAPSTTASQPKSAVSRPKVVEKEQWEIEAEQGLLTEGGRRRLRAQQAANAAKASTPTDPAESRSPSASLSLASSVYYDAATLTLTLPPSAPPTRAHARAFSLIATPQKGRTPEDLLVPAPTLPLAVIAREDFATKLRVLNLSNRRADPTFSFPSASFLATAQSTAGVLPRLDELCLEGCALGDSVSLSQEPEGGGTPVSQRKGLLELLADAFPVLSVLDLSYNILTSDGLSSSALECFLVPSESRRRGLKVLRLRGNRLTALEAFESVTELFRGNRQVPEWRLEELDIRDNEISKLPVTLGLLPMDVLLVDGNTFRVPPRKVWEREGTKGLLSWLRGRI